ncbi:bacteriohopanetetrol glucosamine biosynthesis glycosyltransferase HpnI [Candidatus Nitrosacidococcus sp. I8]|uniref:bacteriohopanetetrol glucosamine biosynthesis glycosyltransferase HpnI n=1 Tax=Candidatus Nitrosacidococcus sp. I8 TaxID=2942908 RepID=UPI002226465A|nr:bacteriohopanetetrol glucosamine biosynthesis glycosyltransferase HpnI [Candidatus Nitrosacidococcus sp. I8]
MTFICVAISAFYLLFAMYQINIFAMQKWTPPDVYPSVSILKPICGLDVELYENLCSFCNQDYPEYQVVFGVTDPKDSAIPIIERVLKEFPYLDLKLVIDSRLYGSNPKVSNLINMYPYAKHDYLIMADSDMRVDSTYLSKIISPFKNPKIGAITCLYIGIPIGGIASQLGAMFINEWFLPCVLATNAIQKIKYCFGPTMGVRRDLLEKIGGFHKLSSYLADDYILGKLVSELGYQVYLVPYLVQDIIKESSLKSLFFHELRWARTIYSVQPVGHFFSIVSNVIPIALLFLIAAPSLSYGLIALSIILILRLLMHYVIQNKFRVNTRYADRFWLILFREIFSFIVWGISFFGREISWRHRTFSVKANNQLVFKETQNI